MIKQILLFALLHLNLPACTSTTTPNPTTELKTQSPDQALQSHLNWILQIINDKNGQVSTNEIQSHFHQIFLNQIPADQVAGMFSQLTNQLAPLQVVKTDPPTTPAPEVRTAITHVNAQTGKFRIVLSVDTTSGLINGLYIQPETPPTPLKPISFQDAERQLQSVTKDSGFMVAEVRESACKPIHAFNADKFRAIGSTFKLYLLFALYEQTRLGKIRWDDPITIRNEWKSLPSGTMQLEPPGSQFPLEKYAVQMISISDNTATDHILHTLGRENIEATMRKHFSVSEKNFPFLATQEFFFLKLKEEKAKAWAAMDKASKRQYLATQSKAGFQFSSNDGWSHPRSINQVEWFASPQDLCQLLSQFREHKGEDPSLTRSRNILARNPGLPIKPGTFRYLGFKGGSEPGVLSLNWLVQRVDGRWFAVNFTANDQRNPLPEDSLISLAGGILLSVADIP